MYKILLILAVALIQIHTVYAAEITQDQQKILDDFCFKLHETIQDEHIFASTNTDPALSRDKALDQADDAQYQKVCADFKGNGF